MHGPELSGFYFAHIFQYLLKIQYLQFILFIFKAFKMKHIKIIDFWVQVVLMSAGIGFTVAKTEYIFGLYFIVGGWQLLSIIIHEVKRWFVPCHSARRWYHNIAYISVLIMLAAPLVPFFFIFYYVMLFMAPLMAIYYTCLCYNETFRLLKRPLSQLK